MIAVDTSALLAIVFGEPEAARLLAAIRDTSCLVGAPTAFEAGMVAESRGPHEASPILDGLLARPRMRVVPFEADHAELARAAFATYGKGRGHPAQLNFGDCMAYAIARRDDLPLLYKGDDFVRTDIRAALA